MTKVIAICAVMVLCVSSIATAVSYDQNVTPGIIFGSGNANGSFAVGTGGGVELGIRAKIRFDATGQPQNTFNSDGAGTYTFQAGSAVGQSNPLTPVWGVDFAVNSDYAGNTGSKLNSFTYVLGVDFDPGTGVNWKTFDPINPDGTIITYFDHSIGNNSTTPSTVTVGNASNYAGLIAANNVAQNTTRMTWLSDSTHTFNPNQTGTYDFYVAAYSGGSEVARTQMSVNVVPEPATMVLLVMGSLSFLVKRRRNRV